MKVSTKGRYALRLAIDIAKHQDDGPVSLREVAKRQNISLKYLEQLASQLTKKGLLKSTRGAHGGYVFAIETQNITAGEILRSSEGDLAPVACLEKGRNLCPMRKECASLSFWKGLDEVIDTYVDSVSLADLCRQTPCP